MIATNVAKGLRSVADNFKDCFESDSYQAISAIFSYFLMSKTSVSELVRSTSSAPSVSTTCKAIRSFQPDRARRRMIAAVARKIGKGDPNEWVLALDDTSNKTYGKSIFASSYWGSSTGVYFGQKIVVVAAVNLRTKKSHPVGYKIISKDTLDGRTTLDEALNLFKEIDLPIIHVVADSWFDSKKMASELRNLGKHYVWQLKTNRWVRVNPSPNVPYRRLPVAFKQRRRIRSRTVWDSKKVRTRKKRAKSIAAIYAQIRGYKTPLKMIAVYNRKNGRHPYGYYASTDRSLSRARIWEIARARWAIETIFRTMKQCFSFGKISCTSREAAHLAVCVPMIIYNALQLKDAEHWGLKKKESVDRMAAKIRQLSMEKSLRMLTFNPNAKAVKNLRIRRSINRVSMKPVTTSAGSNKIAN